MEAKDLGLISSIGDVVVLGRRSDEFDQILNGAAIDLKTGKPFDSRALLVIGKPYLESAIHVLIMKVEDGAYTNQAILAGKKRLTPQPFYNRWLESDVETHGLKGVGIVNKPLAKDCGINVIPQKLDSDSLADLVDGKVNVFLFLGDKLYEKHDAIEVVPTEGATIPAGFDLERPVYEITNVNAVQPLTYHSWKEWAERGAFMAGITKKAERHVVGGLVSAVMKRFEVGKYSVAPTQV